MEAPPKQAAVSPALIGGVGFVVLAAVLGLILRSGGSGLSEIGRIVTLSFINSYTKLVTELGLLSSDVSAAQADARKMAEDFSSGQSDVNLQDVMINLQKANLSFQQMVQVRNKLVSAYHDIMNIQV